MRKKKSTTAPPSIDVPPALLDSIGSIAASFQALNRQAVKEYTPIVAAILDSRSRDTRHIEQTLDGLLDFCGHATVLRLFKELCRHYYFIDPLATAEYVRAYREMWDSVEEEKFHA